MYTYVFSRPTPREFFFYVLGEFELSLLQCCTNSLIRSLLLKSTVVNRCEMNKLSISSDTEVKSF